MRLSDLQPQVKRILFQPYLYMSVDGPKTIEDYPHYYPAMSLEEADGIWFLCPKCFKDNSGPEGTHAIACWRPRVPQHEHMTGPGRWEFVGSSFEDLSLFSNPTSVKVEGGCNAHFTVEKGNIIWNA